MKASRTPEQDLEFVRFYEFHESHYNDIRAALRKIDRVRERLIAAQNELALLVRNLDNPYSERRFAEFYTSGGVTAAQWQQTYRAQGNCYIEDTPIVSRGPLRVVST